MTWLLLGLGWLRNALGAVFSAVLRYPWQAACLALLLASVWLWRGWDKAEARYAAVIAAQKDAGHAQAVVNHEPARKSEEIARKSDAEAPAYYDSVRRAAAAHSVRGACPVSRPDLPRADSVEPGVHGPDPAADLVCRPAVEDSQIIGAAARAAEMHQEALDLIALGVAVPSE